MMKIHLFSVALITALSVGPAWSMTIIKQKGAKVLINLDGEEAVVGDLYKVLDETGAKVGTVKITSLRGAKAQGKVKGKAPRGAKLEFFKKGKKSGGDGSGAVAESAGPEVERSESTGMAFGGMLGMHMNTVKLKDANQADVTLPGSSISYMGFYDMPLMDSIDARLIGGMGGLNVKKSGTVCLNAEECSVDISYLMLGGAARYLFTDSSMRFWAGLEFLMMIPMSKESTAFTSSSISNTSLMSLSGGVDWHFGSGFVPISFGYGMYPNTSSVSASALVFRIGYGVTF